MGGFLWEQESLEKDVFITLSGNSKRTPEDVQAYASFGDDGTTVTVNRYGNIMQISRFLNLGSSGFLDRMNDLIGSLKDRRQGLRLNLVDWSEFEDLPSLGFMYDRWPRYIFKSKVSKERTKRSNEHSGSKATADKPTHTPSIIYTAATLQESDEKLVKNAAFPLSIQCFCSEGIVIQKYLLRVGKDGVDSEKVNWDHDFNDPSKKLESSVVSDRYLLLQHSSKDYVEEASKPVHERDFRAGAALVISAFINDDPAKIDENHCIHLERTEGQLEISVVYKLVILQEDTIEALKSLEKGLSANQTQSTHGESDTEANGSLTGHVEDPSAEDETVPRSTENAWKRDTWAFTEGRQIKYAKQNMETMFCAKNPFRKVFFAQDNRLDFAFRRNLEHILSVCSIPVDAGPHKNPSIAITCGDIAGHRVDSRASLSAIQFLCSMFNYIDPNDENSQEDRSKNKQTHLKADGGPPTDEMSVLDAGDGDATHKSKDPDNDYLRILHKRVRRVLQGHLRWISAKTEPWRDGTFAPHYWPTGRRIDNIEYLASPSLIDTPLQLLKVHHILESESDDRDQQDWLAGKLRLKVRNWIGELHKDNRLGTYAFPRKSEAGDQVFGSEDSKDEKPKYCLTDHVMIGMALSCVEKLEMPTKDDDLPRQEKPERSAWLNAPKQPWCYYTYEEVRSKTLKRFTVVDTTSNQRMFATSRRSDDTRFLLHSKDTYLFFAANMGYFQGPKTKSSRKPRDTKSSKLVDIWRYADDRWTKLLDAQSKYNEFRRSEEKPLWYAIPFVLGNVGKLVSENPFEKSATTLYQTLLKPAWYNGLFPGRLGKQSKPVLHEREGRRDEYWFSTFELPHILWTFGSGEDTMESGKPVDKRTILTNPNHPKDKIEPKIVSDDWLQKPPAILNFTSESDSISPPDTQMIEFERRIEKETWMLKVPHDFVKHSPQTPLGVVIDVPRYSLGYEMSSIQTTETTSFELKAPKTVWESKKRVIWLSKRNKDTAERVYKATRGAEKENVLSFLTRNSESKTYFHDIATAASNEWDTELHLSFFRTSPSDGEILPCMKGSNLASTTMSLRFSGDFSDRYWTCYFLEDGTQGCNDTSLGSRLIPRHDCDIRDSTKTPTSRCGSLDLLWLQSGQNLLRALERPRDSAQEIELAVPGLGPRRLGLEEGELEPEPGVRRKRRADAKTEKNDWMYSRAWQQRRVLELLIYSKMLQELHRSTTVVLTSIKQLALQLENPRGLSSKDHPFKTAIEEAKRLHEMGGENNYDPVAAQWREYAQILFVVEENLTDNIERIGQWDRREKDRLDDQPRWTDRDKRNYATTIQRLKILCQRQAIEINRLRKDVATFRNSLPNRLETIRDDISFRGSQNINLFTYVTVVFLPLGFAAGILSMNGAPDHHLLMNLVTLSLGALGITLFALFNAQIVKTAISPLIHGYQALMKILWPFTKYTFFHVITEPAMKKSAGKTQPSNNEEGTATSKSISSKKEDDWRRRWKQKYEEILKFNWHEARSKLEEELKKSPDPKKTDEITTIPQESSSQKPDTKNATFETDLEQGKP